MKARAIVTETLSCVRKRSGQGPGLVHGSRNRAFLEVRANDSAARRQRLLPDGREGHGRGDRLRVEEAVQDRGLARCEGALQGGGEVLRALDPFPMAAEGAGIGGKIRV